MVSASPPILLKSENGNDIIRITLEKKKISNDLAEQKISQKTAMIGKFFPQIEKVQETSDLNIFKSISETVEDSILNDFIPVDARALAKEKFKKRLSSPDYQINLDNLEELAYVGNLYIGSDKQTLSLIWDTGSAWTAVAGSTCGDCEGRTYEPSTSTSYQLVSSSNMELAVLIQYIDHIKSYSQQFQYGSANLVCYKGQDTVSLDSAGNFLAQNFQFAIVKSQKGLSNEGIIGMSRPNSASTSTSNGPKLMNALKQSNAITKNIFGFMMTTQDHQSFIDIGDYTLAYLKDSTFMKWFPQLGGDFFWTIQVTGFRYSEYNNHPAYQYQKTNYKIPQRFAIVDTGTSFAYLPYDDYTNIMKIITLGHKEAQYYSGYGLVTATCDLSKYQTVYLFSDGTYIGIPPKHYVFDIGAGGDECLIAFMQNEDYNLFLLGDVFLREFYSVWDGENDRLGLSPNRYATTEMIDGTGPTDNLSDFVDESAPPPDYLTTVTTVTGTTVVFSLIGALIYFVYYRI